MRLSVFFFLVGAIMGCADTDSVDPTGGGGSASDGGGDASYGAADGDGGDPTTSAPMPPEGGAPSMGGADGTGGMGGSEGVGGFGFEGEPRCDQGGQEPGSDGLEAACGRPVVGLVRRALGCPSTWTLTRPGDNVLTGGTPNQKLLCRLWNYGWASEAGTTQELDAARDLLLGFFTLQETHGHQSVANADEVLNTSHYQIWSNGMTAARLLAVVHDDAELLAATSAWWKREKALYDLLQRGGSIDAPGARFKPGQAGPSQLRDTLYALMTNRPLSGAPANPNAPWWSDYYNVSAWTLREIFRLGDDLGGAPNATAADLPHLHNPLYVYENGSDYVFVFPKLDNALQPLFWVARVGGETTRAPYLTGTPGDNPNPPPDLPGASLTIVPGVVP